MNASADRLEFAPPPQPGTARAFVLAIIAHVLLMIALTWGINWNRESENIAAEAELWSAVPQQAAPKLVEPPAVVAPPPPPPPPQPVEQKKVEAPPPPAPTVKEPDIAQEREKKRKQELAKKRAQELELQKKQELEREKKLEARKKLEQEKREQLAAQKAAQKAAEDRHKQEELAKAAKEKAKQLADAKRREALREENLKRMQGLAGATGGSTSTGTALRSAGPSDSYAGRVRARVRPNIVFTDDISGNPTAEVEVRMAPDGTITSSKILKSSGVKSWDNAVLRALDKTETLPRDVDGSVHTPLIIEFRPKG
ncbi:MAG: protein TolA [Ramlibacter sp.]|jgi:colicin import membrane protein|nr:protein TolA [Ramlibacter sp.]